MISRPLFSTSSLIIGNNVVPSRLSEMKNLLSTISSEHSKYNRKRKRVLITICKRIKIKNVWVYKTPRDKLHDEEDFHGHLEQGSVNLNNLTVSSRFTRLFRHCSSKNANATARNIYYTDRPVDLTSTVKNKRLFTAGP